MMHHHWVEGFLWGFFLGHWINRLVLVHSAARARDSFGFSVKYIGMKKIIQVSFRYNLCLFVHTQAEMSSRGHENVACGIHQMC